jgi:dienelactone hydrolase
MKRLLQIIALILLLPNSAVAGSDEGPQNNLSLREEIWAIPSIIPMLAYVVRPLGEGPFPLLVMNHGVSLDAKERSYFPVIEFRDAALWFAKQGYVVVAPVRPGYGVTVIEVPERGLFGLFFSGVGNCSVADFRNAGLAIASIDTWIIDYMSLQPFIKPDEVIVVGQSGGGWPLSNQIAQKGLALRLETSVAVGVMASRQAC